MKRLQTAIDFIPPKPIISRFVAPWDTSGWYSVRPELSIGKPLYSNSEACVTALPEKYQGFEYIMTYDSKQDGVDDKQEIDFYLEQDAVVLIALDRDAPYDFLSNFIDTQDEMHSDNCIYRILAANYSGGTQVHIPGFRGDFHHFIVFALPINLSEPENSFSTISSVCTLPSYKQQSYRWYFHESFHDAPIDAPPAAFSCSGSCKVTAYPHNPQRKYVALKNGASIEKQLPTSGQEIAELSVHVLEGSVSVNFCDVLLLLKDNCAYFNGQPLTVSKDNYFHLRFVRSEMRSDTGIPDSHCNLWINHRAAVQTKCLNGKSAQLSVAASINASADLDFISLRDNTEIFAVHENFSDLPKRLSLSPNASASIVEHPFISDKSLCLSGGSCNYSFSPIAGSLSVETKVKPERESFALLPELRSADGQLALRLAMYHNNFYASDGQSWVRIFSGSADWMYYPCGNWYHVKITVDLLQGSYEVYLDGAKRVSGFALASPVQNIAQIGYYTQSTKLYINELRIYDALSICRGLMPPNPVLDVRKPPYNAVGDGKALDTQALQQAINDAAYTGGTVYLHDGAFFTGSLELRSDITLFIDRSASLISAQEHTLHPLHTPGSSLCAASQLGRGLLYGQNICNIRITGGGTLDGQGLYRFKMNDPKANRFADSRPCLIYITYSDTISIEDIRLKGSAFWTVVPLSSRNILMQYLDLNCMNTPNRDGIDPVDCRDMTIRRCNIMAGDDGLCFKSSDQLGCENIDVSHLMIQSLASAIKFGTDSYYSFKHIQVQSCVLKNVNRCGIALESVDGAEVSDLLFENIDMTDVGAPVYIAIGTRQRLPRPHFPRRQGSVSGVQFKGIRFDKAYPFSFTKSIRESMIIGQSREQPVCNILFTDCYFELPGGFSEIPALPKPLDQKYPEYDQHGLSAGHAFCIRYAENVRFDSCFVLLEKPDIRPFVFLSDYQEV